MTDTPRLKLCILDGEQVGAHAQLYYDKSIVISNELDGDIILRDTGLTGQSFRLTVNAECAQIEVLSGYVEIQGQQTAEGSRAELYPYVPLKVGQTILAYGVAEDKRWQDLQRSIGASSHNKIVQSSLNLDKVKSSRKQAPRSMTKMLLWSLPILISAGWIGVGIYMYSATSDPTAKSQSEVAGEIATVLEDSGFVDLDVEEAEAEENVFVIRGYLDTKTQRVLLEQILAELDVTFRNRVVVGEQLAATVQDIYRINGIKAKVKSQGSGIVKVKTEEADLKQLSQAVTAAKRDIVGLRDILAENTEPQKKPTESTLVIDDPGKRVASIVPGNPAYLVTIDGARYFVGAMMPSGHKISAIFDQQVVLDKGGTMTTLKF